MPFLRGFRLHVSDPAPFVKKGGWRQRTLFSYIAGHLILIKSPSWLSSELPLPPNERDDDMSLMETVGGMLPESLKAEFEALRLESLELTKKVPNLSESEALRARAIAQRMVEIVDSQPGLLSQAKQRQGMPNLLREQINNQPTS
jgi:hypothetical protein